LSTRRLLRRSVTGHDPVLANEWALAAVGDVFVNRPDPLLAFEHCAPVLRKFHLVFGNLEGAYTDTPHFAPSSGWRVVAPKHNGAGLREAGFDVLACANNHTVDAGHEGLLDTLELMRSQGIVAVGAGRDAEEAYAPAIIDVQGVRVGILAFASVYQAGYEARRHVPGIAALRIHSHYYIPDWDAYGRVEPGGVPQVRTFPWPEDIDQLRSSIARLRERADVVVVSHHWGQAGRPAVLTDYERVLGHASIDAGADVVLGHHHHFLRGIEIYKGRPIYYGLGHFVFDLPGLEMALTPTELQKLRAMGEYAIYPREGFPLSPFHEEARMTMIAVCRFRGARLQSFGFVPCLINGQNHAVPVDGASTEGLRVAGYVEQISRQAGLAYVQADVGTEVSGVICNR
jgi:poly-gamma-glutamate capsule biosynthesis protein CapA/YwtB (metallophosphatase superfamily)